MSSSQTLGQVTSMMHQTGSGGGTGGRGKAEEVCGEPSIKPVQSLEERHHLYCIDMILLNLECDQFYLTDVYVSAL